MKSAPALIAAALLLLATPALSMAHGNRGPDDGYRDRESRSWTKGQPNHASWDGRRNHHRPPQHWKGHNRGKGQEWEYGHHRHKKHHYRQHHGHHRERLYLGVPRCVFQLRW